MELENRPKRLQSGDIFWVKYNGKYFFGRVVLDMKKAFSLNKLPPSGIFNTFLTEGTYYVEFLSGIYDEPFLTTFEVLFNAFFPTNYLHRKKSIDEEWGYNSNIPVNSTKIDFPESISYKDGFLIFKKGELEIKSNISSENYNDQKVNGMNFLDFEGLIFLGLHLQNRPDLNLEKLYPPEMKRFDIRFNSEFHNQLYQSFNENSDISYYELSLKHGYDISRFF